MNIIIFKTNINIKNTKPITKNFDNPYSDIFLNTFLIMQVIILTNTNKYFNYI